MMSKKSERALAEILEKQWKWKYFHNNLTLTVSDMNRDVERANNHHKANGSAALFKRLKSYLRRNGRIELGEVRAEVVTRNKNDTSEWLKQFGSIRIFHDIFKHYDFQVKQIQLNFDRSYHRVKITVQTKYRDEGYYGGRTTIQYEIERIREERKIDALKKALAVQIAKMKIDN